MITFMNGILSVMTSSLFVHLIGLGAVTASGLLIDFIFNSRGRYN